MLLQFNQSLNKIKQKLNQKSNINVENWAKNETTRPNVTPKSKQNYFGAKSGLEENETAL